MLSITSQALPQTVDVNQESKTSTEKNLPGMASALTDMSPSLPGRAVPTITVLDWSEDLFPKNTTKKVHDQFKGDNCKLQLLNVFPADIDQAELTREVDTAISLLSKKREDSISDSKDIPSILQGVIQLGSRRCTDTGKPEFKNIHKIIEKAQKAVDHSEGLVLPGGQDHKPSHYGAKYANAETKPLELDSRVIMEAALLREVHKRQLPHVLICRGAQAGFINGGGQLVQHIEGHINVKEVAQPTKKADQGILAGDVIDTTRPHYKYHHQAMRAEDAGEDFNQKYQVTLVQPTTGMIEGYEKKGPGIGFGFQFHPEHEPVDTKPFTTLIKAAQTVANNKELIQELKSKMSAIQGREELQRSRFNLS